MFICPFRWSFDTVFNHFVSLAILTYLQRSQF